MRVFAFVLSVLSVFLKDQRVIANDMYDDFAELFIEKSIDDSFDRPNGCISFSVGSGTGCAWMCEYCQNNLGTTNYYFTDGVCSYQSGGCSGNPIAGKQYTCCIN